MDALSATAKRLADGRYEVTLEVYARKLKADELGKETEAPIRIAGIAAAIGPAYGTNSPIAANVLITLVLKMRLTGRPAARRARLRGSDPVQARRPGARGRRR